MNDGMIEMGQLLVSYCIASFITTKENSVQTGGKGATLSYSN